jgi:signal transduction histidine kinase
MMQRFSSRVLLLVILVSVSSEQEAQAQRDTIVLDGAHKFSPGDDVAWASPDYDDQHWQMVRVPGSWSSQGISSDVATAWHRIHFDLPSSFQEPEPAVALGIAMSANEVYLNGVRIGAQGIPGENCVEAPWTDCLYRIPSESLRPGQSNVLAIRMTRFFYEGGIVSGTLSVGDYNQLWHEQGSRMLRTWVIDTCLLTFISLTLLFAAIAFFSGVREPEYLSFYLLLIAIAGSTLLESRLFYATGLKTVFTERLDLAFIAITPTFSVMFVLHACSRRWTKWLISFVLCFPVLAILFLVLPSGPAMDWLGIPWIVMALTSSCINLFWTAQALRRGLPESGALLLGTIVPLVALFAELFVPVFWTEFVGIPVSTCSLAFFLLCFGFALTTRFQRLREQLRAASASLLTAHEEERRRLAREIHDGVGQSLLAIKLNLQMLQASAGQGTAIGRDRLVELVGETSTAIEELRRVALDLRPDALERMDLTEALKWYAGRIQERSGLRISVDAHTTITAGSRVKDHLYRICQEALRNAISHANARQVDITLGPLGRKLFLEVRDDGKGFATCEGQRGLGLATIRERAELLGGSAWITSVPDQGTTVRVELPARIDD